MNLNNSSIFLCHKSLQNSFLWSSYQGPWVVPYEAEALRAAEQKSALFQTQHKRSYPHFTRPFINSLDRIEMKISGCFPIAQCGFCGLYLSYVKDYLCHLWRQLNHLVSDFHQGKRTEQMEPDLGPSAATAWAGCLELGEKCILDQRERNYWKRALPPPVLCCLYGSSHAWPCAGAWSRVLNLTLWIQVCWIARSPLAVRDIPLVIQPQGRPLPAVRWRCSCPNSAVSWDTLTKLAGVRE